MKRFTICLFLVMLVTGCAAKEIDLPQGIRTVRGYVQSVPFSLQRRGTHALLTASGGTMIAYAESSTVNLRLLEGQDVELEGVLEKNIAVRDSPVFVVQKVLSGGTDQRRSWSIPALHLSVTLPRSWTGTITGGSARFTASGFVVPVLTIATRTTVPSPPPNSLYGPLPPSANGALLIVGQRTATADIDAASEAWVVRVSPAQHATLETVFTFALHPAFPVDPQIAAYGSVLRSVAFMSPTVFSAAAVSSSSAVLPNTGSSAFRMGGEGTVCGGVAGILCPKGFFCKITDLVGDSGTCTKR